MAEDTLILVHGIHTQGDRKGFRARRAHAVAAFGPALGVRSYECVAASDKPVANYLLRKMRGTAPAVDAAEVFELDAKAFASALATEAGQSGWREMASCRADGLNPDACFTLLGAPRKVLTGTGAGMRLWWFGRGQAKLSDAQFAAHYTLQHGPLVASYAAVIGLQRYTQVAAEEQALTQALQAVGLGKGAAPVVFAELVMKAPVFSSLNQLSERRRANHAISRDEQRHIDFARSMLLFT